MAKKKIGTDIQVVPESSRRTKANVRIEALLQQAIDKGVPVETMERLLAMRTQLKQERAKEAYDRSMADFQAECPTIVKTKEVKTNSGQLAYRYAPIESIVSQVKDLLQKHGFSYSTGMELLEGGVKVRMRVTHSDGHSEEFYMEVPFGTKTGVMSQTQVAAAATTFAKRYAFCNAFGILTGDEDTDAKAEEAQKDRMPSYQVRRVVPDESDEAGGYRRVEVPPADFEEGHNEIVAAGATFEDFADPNLKSVKKTYPQMNETNDTKGLPEVGKSESTKLRMEIARLLRDKCGYIVLGKVPEHVAGKVMDMTGIELVPENFLAIIEELKSL